MKFWKPKQPTVNSIKIVWSPNDCRTTSSCSRAGVWIYWTHWRRAHAWEDCTTFVLTLWDNLWPPLRDTGANSATSYSKPEPPGRYLRLPSATPLCNNLLPVLRQHFASPILFQSSFISRAVLHLPKHSDNPVPTLQQAAILRQPRNYPARHLC